MVGPEAPLAAGIADAFAHEGLAIFGPTNRRWIGPWGEVAGPYPGTSLPRAVVAQPPQPDPATRAAKRAAWTDTSATASLSLDDVCDPLLAAYGPLLRGEVAPPERVQMRPVPR